jgi:hypothetical protein
MCVFYFFCLVWALLALVFSIKKIKTLLDLHWDDFVSDFDVYKSNDKYCYIIWIKLDISKSL